MTSLWSDSPEPDLLCGTIAGCATGSKREYSFGPIFESGPSYVFGRLFPARSTARARTRYFRPKRSRGSEPDVTSASTTTCSSSGLFAKSAGLSSVPTLFPGRRAHRLQPSQRSISSVRVRSGDVDRSGPEVVPRLVQPSSSSFLVGSGGQCCCEPGLPSAYDARLRQRLCHGFVAALASFTSTA